MTLWMQTLILDHDYYNVGKMHPAREGCGLRAAPSPARRLLRPEQGRLLPPPGWLEQQGCPLCALHGSALCRAAARCVRTEALEQAGKSLQSHFLASRDT